MRSARLGRSIPRRLPAAWNAVRAIECVAYLASVLQDLDSHLAAQGEVAGAVDDAHAAVAHFAEQIVA
jgi:hypothetical protein